MNSSDITLTDLFCGAGGSSTGAVKGGARVVMAANHWQLAIDTHQTNHPTTDHDLADLMVTHPSRYQRTDILWISPECTNHSIAKGRKRKNIGQRDLWGANQVDPSEERSRATMREVVEFTAYHRYELVIVENVVDIRLWEHYDRWLTEMLNLGYDHRALYLNAQFFGVPQSRDRIYIVFWKRGNKPPQLDFRPAALCPMHGEVAAVQVFKKSGAQWGRYGSRRQYLYRCPTCGVEVQPAHVPAAAAIDWSIPSERIADRRMPLKPKTIARIKAGLEKFRNKAVLIDTTFNGVDRRIRSVEDVMPSQTARQTLYLMLPFISELRNRSVGHGIDDVLATITAGAQHHGLITPPFLAILKGQQVGITPDEPLSTIVASACQHWLVSPPFVMSYYTRDDAQSGVDQPFPTIPTENRHSLVVPPFLSSVNYFDDRNIPVDQPMGTMTTQNKFGLVTPPMIITYNNRAVYAPVNQPMPTISTVERNALLTPDELLPECGFRMLEPDELKRGMSFPNEYVILGNKRAQVKQVGNAVCPNVAEWIVGRCVESLQ